MYSLIKKLPHSRAAFGSLILGLIVLLHSAGCKDTGSVGSSFPGSGADVEVDTLELSELRADTLSAVSGSLTYFSAGRFDDPIFGDISATGLVKPLLGTNADHSIGADTRMQLRLAIDKEEVYGDSLASGAFDVVELGSLFRGNEFDIDDTVPATGATVGSFTVTNDDTVTVELADSWIQKYADFYNDTTATRDSVYSRQFPGLAIVPRNSAKILAVDPRESSFLLTGLDIAADADTTVSDSLAVGLDEWAFAVNREGAIEPDPGTRVIHNTLEQVFRFNFDFSSENLEARNISQVKLVFYRDNLMLESTPLGGSEVRPVSGNLRLHLVEGDELPQSIDPGSPLGSLAGTGAYQQDDEAYYIDISSNIRARQLEDIGPEETFYITFGNNNGLIRSSLIYDTEASAARTPKVIITSTKTEEE